MEIIQKREKALSTAQATGSVLSIGGELICYILEDQVRPDPNPATPENEAKVFGETAIPAGRYRVKITMSPKFKKMLPILEDVPGFTGIRVHPGNTHEDTMGCLLPGMILHNGRIAGGTSTPAFLRVEERIKKALAAGEEVWWTIQDCEA